MRIDRRKGMPETGYGQMAAIRQLRKKILAKTEAHRKSLAANGGKASGKPKPISKKKKKAVAPNIDVNMLDRENAQVKTPRIDWSDKNTVSISDQLAQYEWSNHPKRILAMPAGTGKTAVTVRTLGLLQEKYRQLNQAAADASDESAKLTYQDSQTAVEQKLYHANVRQGVHWLFDDDGQLLLPFIVTAPPAVVSGANWTYTINEWNIAHPDNKLKPLIVTSFDRFANLCKLGDGAAWVSMLLDDQGVLVTDEVHNYKNPTSKRSKQLQKIPFEKRIGLSATPFTNDIIMDTISYLIYAGFYNNKTDFMNRSGLQQFAGRFGQFLVYDSDGEIDPDIWPYWNTVREERRHVIFRPDIDISKLDMPDVKISLEQVPGDDKLLPDLASLARAYLKKRAFDSVNDYRMEVVRRIAEDKSRIDKMLEIVNDPNVKQPLIFYWHNSVKDALEQALKKHGVHYQIQNSEHPYGELDLDDQGPILIQYQSGGAGVEFRNSNTTIYYQLQSSAMIDDQSRGRNVRRKMTEPVYQHYLIGPSLYEHGVFELCQQRIQYSQQQLDDLLINTSEEIIKS